MKQPVFEGVATALVTPFKNGTIDYQTLEKLLDIQLAAGIDAVVVCGTTGESAALSDQEQLALIARTIQYTAGRCKVIAGTGSNNTAHAIDMSRVAASMGADAVLCVTPYYNKCTQEGLYRHYMAIADASSAPVIVYNVPSRTGVDVSPATCAKLAEHENINGIKEAGGSITKTAQILQACGDRFHVWSGNDDQTVAMMSLGARGVVSVLSNVAPKMTLSMVRHAQNGDFKTASFEQISLLPLISALFCEVNPIPVKFAMSVLGLDVGDPRMPLTPLLAEYRELVSNAVTKIACQV